MYKIVKKERLNDVVELMEVHAPMVARKCEPGQFIILRVGEDGERIPCGCSEYSPPSPCHIFPGFPVPCASPQFLQKQCPAPSAIHRR